VTRHDKRLNYFPILHRQMEANAPNPIFP